MKYLIITLLLIPFQGNSQEKNFESDVESLDNIMTVLYEVISGEKGIERDWDRFRNLFIPEARLIPSGKDSEGKGRYKMMTPEDYIESSGQWLVDNGFYEVEIKREVQQFGSLVHVWSTYEAYRSITDVDPFMRGINTIQLFYDGTRWWIMNIYWLQESEDNPLPANYLPE